MTRSAVLCACPTLCILLVLCGRVAAQQASPTFAAEMADGTRTRGPLERLGEGWSVRLGGTDPVNVPAGELISLRRADRPLPPPPLDEHAALVNGDRILGSVVGLSGERVVLRLPAAFGADKEVRLPLSAISVLWFNVPDDEENPDRLLRRLAGGQRTRDVVLLRNGDVVEGVLAAIDPKRKVVEVEVDRKTVTLDRGKVAAVALTTESAGTPKRRGSQARLVLADGGRLTLTAAACADGLSLTGTTAFGAELRVPLNHVVALDVLGGRAVYLSDLKPRRYDFTSALDVQWPYVADGSVVGDALRLGGATYDRGVGMHSESRLTYDLRGGYMRFEALVGLDDRTGRGGSVRVKVLVDGKPANLGVDRELTVRSEPLPVRVDVRGARELTLVVEFGRRLDVEDHVNWADARLIK
jgi:hypothetical protein